MPAVILIKPPTAPDAVAAIPLIDDAAKLAAPVNDNTAPATASLPLLPGAEQPVQPASTAAATGPRTDPPQAANDAVRVANDVFETMTPVSSVKGRPNF